MLRDQRFLIIGGTSKAGTTSLYAYLANHPQVCVSALKETRFFIDADYPLPIRTPFNAALAGYGDFFQPANGQVDPLLVEATPDYLYSATALQIGSLLPNARMVFILRNPIDRLFSWYRYAKQRALIPQQMAFRDYVAQQLAEPVVQQTPVHFRALEQGHYRRYLEPFLATMPGRVLVLPYEQLESDPLSLMQEVCRFASIDESFFRDYVFTVENKSRKVRYPRLETAYKFVRRTFAHAVVGQRVLQNVFRFLHRPIKKLFRMNYIEANEQADLPPDLRQSLEQLYQEDTLFMARLFQPVQQEMTGGS